MKHKGLAIQAVVGAVLLLFIFAGDSHAYLDPGTGSLILQMLLAGLFAALLAVRTFRTKIKAFFTHRFSGKPAEKENGIDK
jgi:hypothetical protein